MKTLVTIIMLGILLFTIGCKDSIDGEISSKDCEAAGGKITDVDPDNPKCPAGKTSLGMVYDVNCVCACCIK